MDHLRPFPFALFPREIQLRVLFYLEAPDIFRFREASKAFSELASDMAVEYNVQLDIAGMVDNPSQGSPLIERYEKLLQYQEGWKKAVPSVDPNVPVRLVRDPDFGSYWEWTGGVFPYVVNPQSSQQTLHLYRPGSSVRGPEPKRWTLEAAQLPGGYRMLGCGVDKAQDLLVLSLAPLHYNPDSEEVCILQLLSLQRAGVPHPEASHHLLYGRRLRADQPGIRPPQICEDTLACAIENDVWEVEVWNWKIGTLILRFRPSNTFFHGFALLSQSYILISEEEGPLKVYCIHRDLALDSGSRLQRQNDDAPDLVLKLMPFAAGIDCLTWLSHSPETTSADCIPPFKYDDDLTILALFFDISFIGARQPRSRDFLLLVSVRGLIRILDRLCSSVDSASQPSSQAGRRCLEWDAWGPSSTRLVGFRHAVWNTMPPTSRTRCAVAIRGTARNDHHFDYILLLSVLPHATLGARTSDSESDRDGGDEEEAALAAQLITYGDTITSPKVFRTPVRTTLPISVRCKKVPRGPDYAPNVEIGLFEDGLSLMYLYTADGAMRGDTFTFSV
ncbi:hypothetical protein LXA43DRAFT_891051 [Ganoderma leucocontextum]|nr:hypothetical protein LXA43DRAFT_891051 [Ganoderma leucocontextum]